MAIESAPSLSVMTNRLLGYTANSHNGNIGLVDNWQAKDGAKLAWIGNSECGAFDVSSA
jgi:hypothetical protein